MEKICFDILEKWAKYIEYDENQTTFNLLNYSYEAYNRTKNLTHIIEDYDETGLLAVLTVKRLFEMMMKYLMLFLTRGDDYGRYVYCYRHLHGNCIL